MKRSDFQFDLPDELIARYPAAERRDSRLLVLNGADGSLQHRQFADILDCVDAGDVMVFNNTRVIPARVFGRKSTGGKVEILVERVLDSHRVLAHMRSSKSPKAGAELLLFQSESPADDEPGLSAQVVGREEALFIVEFELPVLDVLNDIGHMPLPPYIDREDQLSDRERYQTVYGEKQGAVAAPTAGLHFDEAMLESLRDKGVDIAYVTLHVGAGTFQPVRAEDIRDHHMHSEYLEVDESVCEQIRAARARGGRVIAVGTTSVRCLETASAEDGSIDAYQGDTDIFIYPGYRFKQVDALLTNFHLSESTLIMLVSAFAGREHILNAYNEAVAERYRFFSYGDAMFIQSPRVGDS